MVMERSVPRSVFFLPTTYGIIWPFAASALADYVDRLIMWSYQIIPLQRLDCEGSAGP